MTTGDGAVFDDTYVRFRCPRCGAVPGPPAGAALSYMCPECGHVMEAPDGILRAFPRREYDCGRWESVYDSSDIRGTSLFKLVSRGFHNPRLFELYYPVVRLLRGSGRSFGTSIELGAGSGTYSLVLKKLGLVEHVILLDYSLDALRMAASLFEGFGETCELIHARIEDAPFADKAFDLALSGGLIEHYGTREERVACLRDHLRLADTVYVQAPADLPAYWFQRLLITALKRGWPFGFERPLKAGEMADIARSAGASVLAWDNHYFPAFLVFYATDLARVVPYFRSWVFKPLRVDVACLMERALSTG